MLTHRLRGLLVMVAMLPMVWLTGCNKTSSAGTSLTYISVAPVALSLYPGQTQAITVTGHYSDGSATPVTSGVTFTASAGSVATISSTGVLTGVGVGTGTVSAAIGDKTADAVVVVTPLFAGPVFQDDYAAGLSFSPFGGSVNLLTVDSTVYHAGTASLKIAVPASGYTGGSLNAATPQNLSAYNAITFWAKASKASATLNVAGFGDSATGDTRYKAETGPLALTTTWTKFIVPIPNASKLTDSIGLFHFAEGSEGAAYSIWLDEIQYVTLAAAELGAPTAATVAWGPIAVEPGKTAPLPGGNTLTYTLPAVQLSNVSIRYFTVASSAPGIASVGTDGLVKGLSFGTATLTATFGGLEVPGSALVTVAALAPTSAPPRPTVDPTKVISLLSKAYTNVPVDTWNTGWGVVGAFSEVTIGGDDMKKYAGLSYAGIEFTGAHSIDATGMTYLHMDVWTPDMTDFHVKLVDFGAGGIYAGGDDSESEVSVNATSVPALTGQKQWVRLDIPLANFSSLKSRAHLAQMLPIDPTGKGTVFIDNVYFHNSPYIDTVPPVLTITDNVPGSTATGDVTFTFTFNEDIGSSFTDSDVVVTGGTPGTLTKSSSTVYTLVVTPAANAVGTITVNVAAGAFSDTTNNASTTAATATQDYDTRVGIKTPMDLPLVTFDSLSVSYGLAGFGGAEDSSIAADPTGGTNKVAKVVKSSGAQTWAGTTLTADGTLGFAHKLPFDGVNTRMTVRVYSPDSGIKVRLKVEDHANNGVFVETDATTTKSNAWETLVFDFANPASTPLDITKTYDKLSIFFDFGVAGAGKTYYFDDVSFDRFATLTFDASTVAYAFAGFGGAEDSSVAVDPTNPLNKAVKVVKASGAQTWAGTTMSMGTSDFSLPRIPFTASDTRMLVRVYSPDAGIKVKLKVEDASNGSINVEQDATTTTSNAWETLLFDFATPVAGVVDLTKTYNKASIFFDFGVAGAGKTYYFDDVTFDALNAPVTFDSPLVTYTLTGFGGAENSTVAVDPSVSTNQVVKVVKSSGAQVWAGTTVSTGANNTIGKIAFSLTRTKLSVRVYSPDAGIKVKLKVEDATNSGVFMEQDVMTTTSNAWETLTFDFATPVAGTLDLTKTFNRASLFFDFGVAGTGKTYYFDDLTFLP